LSGQSSCTLFVQMPRVEETPTFRLRSDSVLR
jgi:hypothetical protein